MLRQEFPMHTKSIPVLSISSPFRSQIRHGFHTPVATLSRSIINTYTEKMRSHVHYHFGGLPPGGFEMRAADSANRSGANKTRWRAFPVRSHDEAGMPLTSGALARPADVGIRVRYGFPAPGFRPRVGQPGYRMGGYEDGPGLPPAGGTARAWSGRSLLHGPSIDRVSAATAGGPEGKARRSVVFSGCVIPLEAVGCIARPLPLSPM